MTPGPSRQTIVSTLDCETAGDSLAASGPRRLRVLHAIHDYLPRHRAGSEIYLDALSRVLGADCHVTVLAATYDPARPHGTLVWRQHQGVPVVEIVNNWIGATFRDTYESPHITRRLGQVIDAVQPDIVHVHNLLNLSLALPELARARRVPLVATLHDYTLACPSGGQRVHRAESHVCREIDASRCARCFSESPFGRLSGIGRMGSLLGGAGLAARLARRAAAAVSAAHQAFPRLKTALGPAASRVAPAPAVRSEDIERRLARARAIYRHFDLVVAPSASIAREFAGLGLAGPRVEVSDYGFPQFAVRRGTGDSRAVRFGFMGTLVWHKGVHVLVEAARSLPQTGWSLEIHGDERVFPEYSAALREQARGLPIRFCGGFDHADASGVLQRFDVLVVPSLWLENSPLVIHEAFMAGVPVIGARMGGIETLVTDGINGVLYDAYSPADLARALAGLVAEPSRVDVLASRVPTVKSIETDAHEWLRRYEMVLTRSAGSL